MATEICGGANSAAPINFCGRLTSVGQRDSRRYREAYRLAIGFRRAEGWRLGLAVVPIGQVRGGQDLPQICAKFPQSRAKSA